MVRSLERRAGEGEMRGRCLDWVRACGLEE